MHLPPYRMVKEVTGQSLGRHLARSHDTTVRVENVVENVA